MSRRRALGTDVSRWQGEIDFEKMHKAGASFTILKASQNNFTDGMFKENWKAAKSTKLLRGAYHFFDMREGSESAKRQAEYFADQLAGDMGELSPTLDFESPGIAGYPDYPDNDSCIRIVTDFCEKFKKLTRHYPMIYSNRAGILRLTPLTKMLKGLDLWIAWYNPKAHKPDIESWPNWRFWQYKYTGDGEAFGVSSKGIDVNAFNGTEEDLFDYANGLGIAKRELKLSKT